MENDIKVVIQDIAKELTEEELRGLETWGLSLVELCYERNIDIHIVDGVAWVYNQEGRLLMQLCLPDSPLAKKALGK